MTILKVLSRAYVDRRVEEIRSEGVAKANKLWQDWNNRRMAAQSEGRVFSEPPPA